MIGIVVHEYEIYYLLKVKRLDKYKQISTLALDESFHVMCEMSVDCKIQQFLLANFIFLPTRKQAVGSALLECQIGMEYL